MTVQKQANSLGVWIPHGLLGFDFWIFLLALRRKTARL
jgi:hypothetical protein